LLRHLSLDGFAHPCDVLIHFSTPGPAKDFLLNLVEELHRQGDLAEGVEVEEFEKALGKLKVRELFKLVRDALARSRKRYLLLIDDIDQITPMQKPMLQELLELRNVQVIATAKTERPRYASLWHHFFPVELRPLSREASDKLVEEFISGRGIPVADEKKNLEVLKGEALQALEGEPPGPLRSSPEDRGPGVCRSGVFAEGAWGGPGGADHRHDLVHRGHGRDHHGRKVFGLGAARSWALHPGRDQLRRDDLSPVVVL
jgi:hypothetical protein